MENTVTTSPEVMDEMDVRASGTFKRIFPAIVIGASIAIAFAVFYTVFADSANFENGDPVKGHPLNFFGTVYKGGNVIPIGISLLLMTVTFAIERLITIASASGKGSMDVFVKKVRMKLAEGDIEGAMDLCDQQKGSVANVVKAGLKRYRKVEQEHQMDKDQKKLAISQEIEEATMLELPMLERNLVIIATIASIGVLIGLIGTVIGMIKAFSAMATAGAPDAASLSVGISEALVNTALGITTSTLSIIFYNYFTSRIDGITYRLDEAGYSIVQSFDSHHKD